MYSAEFLHSPFFMMTSKSFSPSPKWQWSTKVYAHLPYISYDNPSKVVMCGSPYISQEASHGFCTQLNVPPIHVLVGRENKFIRGTSMSNCSMLSMEIGCLRKAR